MKHKVSLSVLSGGGFWRVPQVLTVDAGEAGFSPAEREALARARECGLHLVVFTPAEFGPAPLEHGAACAGLMAEKDGVTVVRDGSMGGGASCLSCRAARVETLAGVVQERGTDFNSVIAVATSPADRDVLMAAGIAFALENAGYDSVSAADRVFPARDVGGLAQAIDAARARATRDRAIKGRACEVL